VNNFGTTTVLPVVVLLGLVFSVYWVRLKYGKQDSGKKRKMFPIKK